MSIVGSYDLCHVPVVEAFKSEMISINMKPITVLMALLISPPVPIITFILIDLSKSIASLAFSFIVSTIPIIPKFSASCSNHSCFPSNLKLFTVKFAAFVSTAFCLVLQEDSKQCLLHNCTGY